MSSREIPCDTSRAPVAWVARFHVPAAPARPMSLRVRGGQPTRVGEPATGPEWKRYTNDNGK